MITGGLGGIGLELAAWLAEARAARLVFTTRGPFPGRGEWAAVAKGDDSEAARRARRLLALEASGAEVLVVEADVSDPVQAARAIDEAKARFGSLDGVFHAAGTLDDGLAGAKTLAQAHAVLRPKAAGALALNALLEPGSLDVFAVFSSTSAVVGPAGQTDYAAANAVLDAVAAGRADGLAIAWGVWAETGMAARLSGAGETRRPAGAHPLLGPGRSEGALTSFETLYRPAELWVLDEHRIEGRAILPGTAYLEIAAAAAAHAGLGEDLALRNANFIAPMAFPGDAARTVRTTLAPDGAGARRITVESRGRPGEPWSLHFEAQLSRSARRPARPPRYLRRHETIAAERLDLAERGVDFGPRWRCLTSAGCFGGETVASVALDRAYAEDLSAYAAHPALMDAAATVGLFLLQGERPAHGVLAPLSVDEVALFGRLPARFRATARLVDAQAGDQAKFDVELTDKRGRLIASLTGFTLRWVGAGGMVAAQAAAAPAEAEGALAQLLASGIRTAEAPAAFEAALAHPGRQVIVSPTAPARLRADLARPVKAPTRPTRVDVDEAQYADAVEASVARMCAELLGVERMGPQDDFLAFGGGSLTAIRLFARIRRELGADLALSALFQAPTIAELAGLVRQAQGEPERPSAVVASLHATHWSPLVRIRTGRPGVRAVFCVHGAGGNVVAFKPLADRLGTERPFYGLQAQGIDGRLAPNETIEAMARCYVEAIRTVQAQGPYLLAGYSGGGVIAYEMAQQLLAAGERADIVAMIDSLEPSEVLRPISMLDRLKQLHRIEKRLIWEWPKNWLRDRRHIRFVKKLRAGEITAPLTSLELAAAMTGDAYSRAQNVYRPKPYGGDILLIRAREARMYYLRSGDKLGWDKIATGAIEVLEVEADHLSVFSEPSISRLAAKLRCEFDRLDARLEAHAAVAATAAE